MQAQRGSARMWISLVVCMLALRLPGLIQSLWFDEVWRTRIMLGGPALKSILLYDIHGPLYNALMWVWIIVLGDSEISIRIPSLLASLALIAAVYAWTSRRLGRLTGMLAAWYLTLSPVHVWFSTEAKNNMLTVLLTTLGVMASQRALARRRIPSAILAGFICSLAFWTSFQSVLMLMPAWVFLLVSPSNEWSPPEHGRIGPRAGRVVTSLTAIGTMLLLCIPLVILKLSHAESLYRDYLTAFKWFEPVRLLTWFETGNALPFLRESWVTRAIVPAAVLLIPMLLGLFTLAFTARARLALICFIGPMVLMLLADVLRDLSGMEVRMYQPRNLTVMLPWLAIVFAAGVARFPAGWRRWLAGALVLGLTAFSSISMRTWCAEDDTVMHPNPDWRGAAAWMESGASSDRYTVISRTPLLPIAYYSPHATRIELGPERPFEQGLSLAAERAGGGEMFLLIHSRWNAIGIEERDHALQGFDVLDQRHFRLLNIYRIRRR